MKQITRLAVTAAVAAAFFAPQSGLAKSRVYKSRIMTAAGRSTVETAAAKKKKFSLYSAIEASTGIEKVGANTLTFIPKFKTDRGHKIGAKLAISREFVPEGEYQIDHGYLTGSLKSMKLDDNVVLSPSMRLYVPVTTAAQTEQELVAPWIGLAFGVNNLAPRLKITYRPSFRRRFHSNPDQSLSWMNMNNLFVIAYNVTDNFTIEHAIDAQVNWTYDGQPSRSYANGTELGVQLTKKWSMAFGHYVADKKLSWFKRDKSVFYINAGLSI